jgi:hypothetical protein
MAAYHSNQQMLLIPRLVYVFYLLQGWDIIDCIVLLGEAFVILYYFYAYNIGYCLRVQCLKLVSTLEQIPAWRHSKDARKSKIDTIMIMS